MSWYKGPTLMQALENSAGDLPAAVQLLAAMDRPARMVVQKVYRRSYRHETRELIVAGCIVAGKLSVGDRVVIQPSNLGRHRDEGDVVIIESIESHHQPRHTVLAPHESVAFKLRWPRRNVAAETEAEAALQIDEANRAADLRLVDMVERGSVIGALRGSADDQPRRVKSFKAQIVMMYHPNLISSGYKPTIRVHAAMVPCSIKLITKIDKRSGRVVEDNPKSVRSGDACMAELTPAKPLCLDTFASNNPLGRLCLADLGRTVGVGVVREAEWDASDALIPCHVPRPDRMQLQALRRQARRAKRAAKQNKWVNVLRSMPEGSLKVTVLAAYIDSQCGWRPASCYVRLGVGVNGKTPTVWHTTDTRGKKCKLGFCQKFILPNVDPATTTLYVSAHDAAHYPSDYGTKEIPLSSIMRYGRGWRETFELDETPYSLSNSVTLNFYLPYRLFF